MDNPLVSLIIFFTLYNPFEKQLSDKYVSGGIEGHVYYLSRKLDQLGCQILVVTMGNVKKISIEKKGRTNLIVIPDRGRKGLFERSLLFILEGRRIIKNLERRKVNAFIGEGGLSSPLAFFKPKSAKVILTIHTLDGEDLANIKDSIRLRKQGEAFIDTIKYLLLKLWRTFLLLRSDELIFVSNAVYREFRKYYWYLPKKSYFVIENGFPGLNKEENRHEKTKYIDYIYVGRIGKRKCVDDIIRACSLLRRTNDFSVIIVGEGALRYMIEEMTEKNNLTENIKFTGYIESDEKVLELMSNAKFLILPSAYESDPLVIKEALSVGTPCIVSDISALEEKIIDGKNGFVFRLNNFEDLSKKMEKALNLDEKAYDSLCKESFKSVVGRDWRKVAEEYLRVIR